MPKRSIVVFVTLLLALYGALFSGATPAYAHAIIVRADPPDGASLSAAPEQVRLWFSEPVALNFTMLELVDGDGRRIPVTAHGDAASLAVAVRSGEAAGAVLVMVDLPNLAPNVYRLNWRTLSNNDLHNTSGSIVFGVQRPADRAPAVVPVPAPAPLEVALRWLNLGALAALLGALALALLTTKDEGRRTKDEGSATDNERDTQHATRNTQHRLLRLALWSGLLALVAGVVLLMAQALAAGGADQAGTATLWQIVGGTSYGAYWALRQGILIALVIAIAVKQKQRSSFSIRNSQFFILPALALVVTQALQSHATAFNDLSIVRVLADALHVLTAGVWSGGVLALALVVVPLLRGGSDEAALAWTILRRFGVLAATSLAALLVTGLFMSGQQVASLDALLTTLYGQALLLKVALALGVALIGLLNAAALHPRVATHLGRLLRRPAGWAPFSSRRLARTITLEAGGALIVLLVAASLSATQPARGPEFDPPAEAAASPAVTTSANDLVVTLAVKPNRPGQNFIALGVFNTRRPAPAPIDRVAVRLLPPTGQLEVGPLTAEPIGNGHYQIAGDSIDVAGGWRVAVTVTRPGMPNTMATIPWSVLPPAPPLRPVLLSNRPLAPALTLAAAVIALLLGVTAIGFWARRWIGLGLRRARALLSERRLYRLQKD